MPKPIMTALVYVVLFCGGALAQTLQNLTISIPPPKAITLQGADGKAIVVISLIDGSVKLSEGKNLDTASREFWDAISKVWAIKCP